MTIMKKNEKSDCSFSIKQILKDVYNQGSKDHIEQSRESRESYFDSMATKIIFTNEKRMNKQEPSSYFYNVIKNDYEID